MGSRGTLGSAGTLEYVGRAQWVGDSSLVGASSGEASPSQLVEGSLRDSGSDFGQKGGESLRSRASHFLGLLGYKNEALTPCDTPAGARNFEQEPVG